MIDKYSTHSWGKWSCYPGPSTENGLLIKKHTAPLVHFSTKLRGNYIIFLFWFLLCRVLKILIHLGNLRLLSSAPNPLTMFYSIQYSRELIVLGGRRTLALCTCWLIWEYHSVCKRVGVNCAIIAKHLEINWFCAGNREAQWQLYSGEDEYERAEAEYSFELGKEVLEWTWIVTPSVHIQVWQVHTVQTSSRAGAAWNTGDGGVLSRSLEVRMWQQVVHAMKTY